LPRKMEAAGVDQGDTGQKVKILQIRSGCVESGIECVEVEGSQQKSTADDARTARPLFIHKGEGFVMTRRGQWISRDFESRRLAVEVALPRNPERRQSTCRVHVLSGSDAVEAEVSEVIVKVDAGFRHRQAGNERHTGFVARVGITQLPVGAAASIALQMELGGFHNEPLDPDRAVDPRT